MTRNRRWVLAWALAVALGGAAHAQCPNHCPDCMNGPGRGKEEGKTKVRWEAGPFSFWIGALATSAAKGGAEQAGGPAAGCCKGCGSAAAGKARAGTGQAFRVEAVPGLMGTWRFVLTPPKPAAGCCKGCGTAAKGAEHPPAGGLKSAIEAPKPGPRCEHLIIEKEYVAEPLPPPGPAMPWAARPLPPMGPNMGPGPFAPPAPPPGMMAGPMPYPMPPPMPPFDVRGWRLEARMMARRAKRHQVKELLKLYHVCCRGGLYEEAEKIARTAHEIDPKDAAAEAAIRVAHQLAGKDKARTVKRVKPAKGDKKSATPAADKKNQISELIRHYRLLSENRFEGARIYGLRAYEFDLRKVAGDVVSYLPWFQWWRGGDCD